MGTLALKKEIKRLETAFLEAQRKNADLLYATHKDGVEIKRLHDDLAAEKEKYAALLEKYIAMMETKVNSHRAYEKKIKNVKIIVREQEKRPVYTDDMSAVEVKEVSTVSVKFQYGGIEHGDYIVHNKPTLEVCDVVEAANVLFVSLLSALDQPQQGKDNV